MKFQAGQENLARRLAQLRARVPWTAGDVQRALAEVGCVVPRNAALRIEQGKRQVTVDELVAFSKIYGKTVEDLLTPVELVGHDAAKRIAARIDDEMGAVLDAVRRLGESLYHLRDLRTREPEAGDYLVEILAEPYLAEARSEPPLTDLQRRLRDVAADAISEAWRAAFEGDRSQPFAFIENAGRIVLNPDHPFITEAERREARGRHLAKGSEDGQR